jgi:putative hydrolase of the HAD superfamily
LSVIRGVIIDFGGVLALLPSAEALARLQTVSGFDDRAAFLSSWRRHRLSYDVGEVSAEDYWRLVGSERRLDYDAAALARLRAEDAACWSEQNAAVVEWLGAVKAAGLRFALLSNISREQWAALKESLGWLRLCDVVVLSYELRLAKPDPEIYRRCVERLSLSPGEILFIDDQPENVAAAAELGINALLFTTIDDLRRDLANRFDGIPLPAVSARPQTESARESQR